MVVLHGSPYSGDYPNTTWPGYTTFGYEFTEMWNKIQPCWIHIKDTLDYIGRTQYELQQGTPKVDLAFYLFETPYEPIKQYPSNNLEDMGKIRNISEFYATMLTADLGYTYDYLGPDNILSSQATVDDGTLAPSGPAYKALIFAASKFNTTNFNAVSESVAARVSKFAEEGLPIVFVGQVPAQTTDAREDQVLASGPLQQLMMAKGVHFVSSLNDVPHALQNASISPRVSPLCGKGALRTIWRSSPQNNTDYLFLHNDKSEANACQVDIMIDPSITPYFFDAWTGGQQPIMAYNRTASGISVPVQLQANQTSVIALRKAENRQSVIVQSTSDSVVSLNVRPDGAVTASLSGPATITSQAGKMWTFDFKAPPAANLNTWNLSLEDWHAPSNRFSVVTAIDVHNFTAIGLTSWATLAPGLDVVGGIGRYTSTFTVPNINSIGGILSTGQVVHSLRVYIDGKLLRAVDPSDPKIDISGSISPGKTHSLMVEVTSPLFNRIKAEANQTMIWGNVAGKSQPLYNKLRPKDYGLVGPGSIQWISIQELS